MNLGIAYLLSGIAFLAGCGITLSLILNHAARRCRRWSQVRCPECGHWYDVSWISGHLVTKHDHRDRFVEAVRPPRTVA